jgi:NAD(P)-dependent dehydrogenase (short-subunit alcohol dehydrogenase family)
MRAAG